MSPVPISYPGRFAPGFALNFANASGTAVAVSDASPLPVVVSGGSLPGPVETQLPPPPLAGTTAAALTAGPFAPLAGRAVVLSLTGSWSGTVRLLRSVDGGQTLLPVTIGGSPWAVFARNVCEPVWEETEVGAELYLQITPTAGTVTFRVAQ